jgi:hypothetical protein
MPLRGVYELDVDPDGNFARFQQQFAAHQDDMRAQHRQNTTYSRGVNDYFKQFSSELNSLARTSTKGAKDQKAAMESVSAEVRRAATFQGQFASLTMRAGREMREMAKSTKGVADHIISATGALLKWTGIGAVLGGIAGPPLLASSVFNRAYSAGGLGITSGQQQAAGLAYGKFFNPDSALSNIASAQSDYSKMAVFSALGIDPRGKSPAELLPLVARAATDRFMSTDRSTQAAHAYKLDEIFSLEDLRRMAAQRDEMPEADRRYKKYSQDLAVSPQQQRDWVDFYFQLRRAGDVIENSFVKGLSSLTEGADGGALGQLANGVAEAIQDFMTSKELKTWLTELAGGVKSFAQELTTPEFRAGVVDFVHDIGDLAKSIKAALVAIGIIPKDAPGWDGSDLYSHWHDVTSPYVVGGPDLASNVTTAAFGIGCSTRSAPRTLTKCRISAAECWATEPARR